MTTIQAGAEPRTALPGGRGVPRSELTISLLSARENACAATLVDREYYDRIGGNGGSLLLFINDVTLAIIMRTSRI